MRWRMAANSLGAIRAAMMGIVKAPIYIRFIDAHSSIIASASISIIMPDRPAA